MCRWPISTSSIKNLQDLTKCLKHAACQHTPFNQSNINYKLYANIRMHGMQNFKSFNTSAYQFISHIPLSDLTANIESVLDHS